MSKALVVIDLQNDYFPGGLFPLWNSEATHEVIERAIASARASGILVVLIQHIVYRSAGIAPPFNDGPPGAAIHLRILAAAPDAPVVVKALEDSFFQTNLEATLPRRYGGGACARSLGLLAKLQR